MSSDDTQCGSLQSSIDRLMATVSRRTPEEAAEAERKAALLALERRWRTLTLWGTPKRVARILCYEFDSDTHPVRAVEKWHGIPGLWCLVLSGPAGIGKSLAAAHWLWLCTEGAAPINYPSHRWYTAAQLCTLSSYDGEMSRLNTCGQLVIDDLGCEYIDRHGHLNSRLDALIDTRYAQERKTLITTNLNAADFTERYGARVIDRLREGGRYVEISGRSLRGSQR